MYFQTVQLNDYLRIFGALLQYYIKQHAYNLASFPGPPQLFNIAHTGASP